MTGLADFAITDVTVIDVRTGQAIPAQTVSVMGDNISQIVPADSADSAGLHGAVKTLDGRGLYLMPGLVDAHAHYFEPETFGRLFLAHGVTLVREMGMADELTLSIRDGLRDGSLLGPELFGAGAILDGVPPLIPLISHGVATPDEARDAVQRQAAAGFDVIKVYSTLKVEVFRAIVDEAHRLGLRVAGHVPDSVPIEDAAAMGLDSSEHFFGFEKLIGKLLDAPVRYTYTGMGADVAFFLRLGEVEPDRLAQAFDSLRRSGLTVCPTIVTFKAGMRTTSYQSGEFDGSEFVAPELLAMWRTLWADQSDLSSFIWETWARLVAQLHAAGVPLMVGTDLSVPGILPGFSVHDEMEIWQDAGIPAPDVLRGATIVPTTWLGLGARLGSIEEGKAASMLLVRGNPLDDVRNARDVEGVFLRGQYFDRLALDQLLAEARELAQR
ncbi:MAG: amidohydrolase family protein [Candidatus Bipolaricaulota bacterium]